VTPPPQGKGHLAEAGGVSRRVGDDVVRDTRDCTRPAARGWASPCWSSPEAPADRRDGTDPPLLRVGEVPLSAATIGDDR
jgi:hypothetical protein